MRNNLLPKIIISVICIAAVAAIMLRGDETPEYSEGGGKAERAEEVDGFTFEPEELTYDGNGDLDLLLGVSLPGFTKQELDDLVYVTIETAGSLSHKRVEYTAEKDGVRYRSVRSLHLESYTGPKITMPQHIPDVKEEIIDKFGTLLQSEEDFSVDDGFGNDASAHMEVEAERAMTDSSVVQYTISIENVFGDRDRVTQDVVLSGEMYVIALTDSQVVIQAGQTFDPADFIARAEKPDGSSAYDDVMIIGTINTEKPGTYMLTYQLSEETAQLNVVVE